MSINRQMDKQMNISQRLLVLAVVIVAILSALQYFVFPQYCTASMCVIPLFFLVVYSVAFTLVLVPGIPMKAFLSRFSAYKTAKLLLSMAAMLLSAFFFRDDAKQLLIAFLVYYLLLMFPETLYAMYMRKNAS